MKALRALRTLALFSPSNPLKPNLAPIFSCRSYNAQPQEDNPDPAAAFNFDDDDDGGAVFDSAHYAFPDAVSGSSSSDQVTSHPTWDESFREKVDRTVFGVVPRKKKPGHAEEMEVKKRLLAKALLEAALEKPDEGDNGESGAVREEDQRSLSVGIMGAPNAGKSSLTNYLVGKKVSAVSRKTNTTVQEVLGTLTQGNTQICFFDTPGVMLKKHGFPYNDIKVRVQSAWGAVDLYDVLLVIFDAQRHLSRPDSRVVRLIQRMGTESNPKQKRVLCMNKIDLVGKKKDLLKIRDEFKDLPGYDRFFMMSGLKGAGVKDLKNYLMEQAVKRPWDEDPFTMNEETMKSISLEVVRERLLDHVHQEIPYSIEHRLMDWKELRNGSLRIEQHLITRKDSQRRILVGKKGSKIGRIGVEANEELRSIFKRDVHLILQVRLKP